MSRQPFAIVGAVLLLASSPSVGASNGDQLDFRYDKAELASADGAAKLYERLVALANRECRTIGTPPINNPRADECARELVDQLVARINSPLLASLAKQGPALAAAER